MEYLEALVQLEQMSQQNMLGATMINYLGKSIGTNLNVSALENGSASWNINLGSSAETVKYDIYDQSGNIVYSETADGVSGGEQQFSWDGIKNSGAEADEGAYYLVVTAETA